MADNTSTSNADSEGLRAVVKSTGSDPIPAKPLSDDLQPYVQQVLDMDPFEDVSGASSAAPGKVVTAPSIEALPPDLQNRVRAQLQNVPPEQMKAHEGAAVLRVLKHRVYSNRAETGIAADSLPYHKTDVEIAGQVRQLDREIAQYRGYLDEVSGHETVTDPATGEKTAQPILRVTGARRRGFESTLHDLERRRRLLVDDDGNLGVEAIRLRRESLEESAKLLKERAEAAEDALEVKRQVAAKLREDRIAKQVEAQLRLARNEAAR